MTTEAFDCTDDTRHASLVLLRTQARALLSSLDESGLSEAAALMAMTVDAIDAGLKRLPDPHTPSTGPAN